MWRALSLRVSCIACSNPVVSERWKGRGVSAEEREVKLGRFLCFLNTLSATHSTIRAVLAEDRWFSNLVQIVNIALHYLHVRTCFLHVGTGTGPPVETDGGEREIGNVGGVALAPGW